jgi:hypothetical protein
MEYISKCLPKRKILARQQAWQTNTPHFGDQRLGEARIFFFENTARPGWNNSGTS